MLKANLRCECSDKGCPVHVGESACFGKASRFSVLYRVDMQDETGTRFCEGCEADAFESGLFTDERAEDESEARS